MMCWRAGPGSVYVCHSSACNQAVSQCMCAEGFRGPAGHMFDSNYIPIPSLTLRHSDVAYLWGSQTLVWHYSREHIVCIEQLLSTRSLTAGIATLHTPVLLPRVIALAPRFTFSAKQLCVLAPTSSRGNFGQAQS